MRVPRIYIRANSTTHNDFYDHNATNESQMKSSLVQFSCSQSVVNLQWVRIMEETRSDPWPAQYLNHHFQAVSTVEKT